jgi:hypothetical protein
VSRRCESDPRRLGSRCKRAGRAENLGRSPQASAGTLCHDMGQPAVSIHQRAIIADTARLTISRANIYRT